MYIWKLTYNERSTLWSTRQWVCPAVGLPARVGMAVGLPAVGPQNWYVQKFRKKGSGSAGSGSARGGSAELVVPEPHKRPARGVMAVGLPAVGPQNFMYNLFFSSL